MLPMSCQLQLRLHADGDTNLYLGVKNRKCIDDEHSKILLVEHFRIAELVIIYNLITQI